MHEARAGAWIEPVSHVSWVRVALVGLLVLFLSIVCIALSRTWNNVAFLWLPNAFVYGVLLRHAKTNWPYLIASSLLAGFAANKLYGDSVAVSLGLCTANIVEVSLAAWFSVRFCPRINLPLSLPVLGRLVACYALGGLPFGVLIGASTIALAFHASWWDVAGHWILGDLLGLGLLLVPVLLMSTQQLLALFQRSSLVALLVSAFLFAVLVNGGFHAEFPFVYVIALLCVFAAWRGAFQVSIVALILLAGLIVIYLDGRATFLAELRFTSALQVWTTSALSLLLPIILGVVVDQLRAQSLQLHRSELRFGRAMQAAASGFLILNQQGRILDCNPHFCWITGYAENELLGRFYVDLLQPEDKAVFLADLEKIQKRQIELSQEEVRLVRPDSEILWVDMRISCLNEQGEEREWIVQLDNVTDRHQQQDAIHRLSERLKLATLSAQIGIWDLDVSSQELRWDQQMYHMYGLPFEGELIDYNRWERLLVSDDLPRVAELFNESLLTGKDFATEFRFNHPTLGVRHVRSAALIVQDIEKKAQRVVGVNFDITEQKLAEQGIREAQAKAQDMQEFLQSVVDAALSFAIIATDKAGVIQLFSAGAEQLLGYQASEMIGIQTPVVLHQASELQERGQELSFRLGRPVQDFDVLTAMPERKGSEERQWIYLHKDQHLIPVSLVVSVLKNPSGEISGYLAIARDVTQQRRTESSMKMLNQSLERQMQENQQARNEFSQLFERAPGALIVVNVRGEITHANAQAHQLFEYAPGSLVGLSVDELVPDSHRDVHAEYRARFVNNSMARPMGEGRNFFARCRGGRQFSASINLTPLLLDRQQHTMAAIYDLTPQLQIQETLQRAKEAAEQASLAKSDFVANMSHEIRTPMNAVMGLSYLLGKTNLSPDQRKYVEMIITSGQGLLGVINDILDFSKIEAGKMDLAPVDFSLDELFNNLATLLAVSAGEKDLDLTFGVGANVPSHLHGDVLRLRQVLLNLLSNAIKFTLHGEVTLQVDCREISPGVLQLECVVRDTGIGISADQLDCLFTPFGQADTSTTRRFGGSGLGLTISLRLVNLMGGDILVKSELGVGSEFKFFVQMQTANDASLAQQRPALGDVRILLIDAHAESRLLLAETIQAWGWQLEFAATGQQALERLARVDLPSVDVVLADWRLPDMNGVAVAVAIKERHQQAQIPVLMMVNVYHHDHVYREEGGDQVDAVLLRPVTGSALDDALYDALAPLRGLASKRRSEMRDGGGRLDGVHLLLVEDNLLNQAVAQNVLEQSGATLEIASDGQQAVTTLKTNPERFQLVLMDIQMPVMDGFTAARLIREELQLTLPILAMTAGVLPSERQRCLAAGMLDFIAKPIDVSEMLAIIRRHLPEAFLTARSIDKPLLQPPALTVDRDDKEVFSPDSLLTVLGGDVVTQKKLLRQFVLENRGLIDEIRLAVVEQRFSDAKRSLHTLKGTAGTLHASKVVSLAKEAESVFLEKEDGDVEQYLPLLQLALFELLDSIDHWLGQHVEEEQWLGAEASRIERADLLALLDLLGINNMAACDLYDRLRPGLKSMASADDLLAIDKAMDGLDFSKAQQLLQTYL